MSCDVAVIAGRAILTGNARSRRAAREAVAAARLVEGVAEVDDRLVADDELERVVAMAINQSPMNLASRLVVRSALGHVSIGGTYDSTEAWAEAVRVGGGTHGVVAATAMRSSDVSS